MRLRVCSNDSEYHNQEGDEKRRNEQWDDLHIWSTRISAEESVNTHLSRPQQADEY